MPKKGENFAQSPLGRAIAGLAQVTGQRPSELMELEGSALERLFWDLAIIPESPMLQSEETGSVKDQIRSKRRRMGVPFVS